MDAEQREGDLARECLSAIDVLRMAKNAFFWLAIVAIALHLLAWYGSKPSPPRGPIVSAASVDDGAAPEDDIATRFARVIESRLTLVGFVGRASVLVCAGAYIICLLVSLVGRIGGTVGFAKACVWSLAALAMVTPWVSADVRQLPAFRSAFFGEEDLYTTGDGVVAFIRFVLCPLLVAAFLVLAQLQFRSSYRRVSVPASTRLPIHEV